MADNTTSTIVREVGTCRVILTDSGFYTDCTACDWAVGVLTSKFAATQAAMTHVCAAR